MRTPLSERLARGLLGFLEKAGTSAGAERGWKTRKRLLPPVEREAAERRPARAEEAPAERRGRALAEAPIPRRRRWVDHAPGLPRDTLGAHTDPETGRLTPERQALHDDIVRRALEGVPETPQDRRPVAVLMVGTPGSGKTTVAENLGAGDFAHVEADLYKQQLPEYRAAVEAGARDAGAITHEEGKVIARRVWEGALGQGKSVLYDATGSWLDIYYRMIDQLRRRGYEVHVVMPDVPVEEALRRVRRRFEDTGRSVPDHAVRKVASVVSHNFRKLRHEADGFLLFDNSGESPRLVWEGKGGEETVHDEDYVQGFRRRAR